jgi:lipopolysaccharide export LptBFGC system permease protein LptF
VIRTLKTYLAKDLLKATVLAGVVFTLVMTIFAVIEPLRERGLSSQQALKLFGFSMPVMVSLTLPIAALFAATIVYGRFAQDNEMMACRASGICTLSLLSPAIWLGLVVSLITLGLGLYVAPRMLWLSQHTIERNLQHIAFHGLKSKGHVEFAGKMLHADHVDEKTGSLAGVVALDLSDRQDALYLVADAARLEFRQREGKTFWTFQPNRATARRQSGRRVLMMEEERIQRGTLPDLIDYKPKLYDWTQLLRARARPQDCPDVRTQVSQLRREVCVFLFYEDLVATLKADRRYAKLEEFVPPGESGRPGRIELVAPWARMNNGREVILGPAPAGRGPEAGPERPVLVRQWPGDGAGREYWARTAGVTAEWDEFHSAYLVTMILKDVYVRDIGEPFSPPRGMEKKEIGRYAVPAEIVRFAEQIDPRRLQADPSRQALAQHVSGLLARLDRRLERLLARVCAEIHLRLGYGISCMLMVMLGAALGLWFRGGQMLAAFAISAVPASLVIVMLFMGKELIKNPGVPEVYGIAAIWGGVGALALATAYVYLVPMRR